ncbi:MAG: preprotein translocase subunit SecE [bacterium]
MREVTEEMKKVNWPSRAQLIESSVIVVILSLILAIFTFSVDFILNRVLKLIL